MRIAIVTESFLPRTDGVVRTVLELLGHLRAHDHQVLVFAAGPGPQEYLGYKVVRVNGPRLPSYPDLTIAPYCRSMRPRMRRFRPDVVHLASPFVLGVQGQIVGKTLHVPVAAHFQTDIARYAQFYGAGYLAGVARWHMRRLHNRCQATYAPTASVKGELEKQGYRNVGISGRGVDTMLFTPTRRSEALRATLLKAGEHTLLLYVGRLSTEKNLDVLKVLIKEQSGTRLVFVGEGPHRAALEQAFQGLPATFVGLKRGEELATYYASGDVFTFPSKTETFGQVVQEAMASGLPILAFRSGGVQDLFIDGEEGFLVAPNDARRWQEAARTLIDQPDLRVHFGRRARRSAEGRTWSAIFERLLKEYQVLASGAGDLPERSLAGPRSQMK